MLREILAIKEFRELRAEIEVGRQRAVWAEAVQAHQRAEVRLTEFRREAREREDALFTDLCSRLVRVGDIQDVHLAVGELREQERAYQQRCEQADQDRDEQARSLDNRRADHVQALRMRQKFIELVQSEDEQALKAHERKEDAELEETVELRRQAPRQDDQEEFT